MRYRINMKIKDLLSYLLVIILAILATHFFIHEATVGGNKNDSLQTNWHKNPTDQLTLYSAKWCKACQATKKYFKEKNIQYTNIDIELSPDKNIFLKDNNINSIPVITYNNQTIIGFDKVSIEKLLSEQKVKYID